MPKKQFAFEKGGSKRLKLSWGAYSKNLKIELDGEYLAGCRGRELKAGKEFPLPDGSRLSVRMTKPEFLDIKSGQACTDPSLLFNSIRPLSPGPVHPISGA